MFIGTSGAEGSLRPWKTSSLCDMLMLSPMLDVEAIGTSGGILVVLSIFSWVHSALKISTALRRRNFRCGVIRTSDGHRNFRCYWIFLSPPCTCPTRPNSCLTRLYFFTMTWVSWRWIERLDGELDVSIVNWTSQRWIGRLGYGLDFIHEHKKIYKYDLANLLISLIALLLDQ